MSSYEAPTLPVIIFGSSKNSSTSLIYKINPEICFKSFSPNMGLETLLEAARFIEYQAEIAANAARAESTFSASITVNEPGPQQQSIPQPEGSGNKKNLINGTVSWANGDCAKNGKNDNDLKRKHDKELHSRQVREQRAHLRRCMDGLRDVLPKTEAGFSSRMTTMTMLKSAVTAINQLETDGKAYDKEKERLAKEKKELELRFAALQQEVGDIAAMEPETDDDEKDDDATGAGTEHMENESVNLNESSCDN